MISPSRGVKLSRELHNRSLAAGQARMRAKKVMVYLWDVVMTARSYRTEVIRRVLTGRQNQATRKTPSQVNVSGIFDWIGLLDHGTGVRRAWVWETAKSRNRHDHDWRRYTLQLQSRCGGKKRLPMFWAVAWS